MTSNPQFYNTAQIRRLLNTAFDDPGLDAFCHDYFYDVYNRFSRGMRKDEKITLLLDHCRRAANGFESLRRAARSEYEASGSRRDELRTLAEAFGSSPAKNTLPPGQPAPAKDSTPLPRLTQIKIKTRQDRLEALVEQYEAANRQLSSTLDAANCVIIERQIKDLEQEIQAVEDELNQLLGIPEHLTPVLLKNEPDPAGPQSVKLKITPIERLENNCPHISIVVKNRKNKTVFCKVESHGIYNSSGEDVKRSVSSYANHFSWSGGSDRGTKEIPANLDGIINLAKVNKRGYGIAFLFDENPHSYWGTEGTYKLDLKIGGTFGENSSGMESIGQRVIVEFEYIKKETQNSIGEVVNDSELKLLTWRLIDTD